MLRNSERVIHFSLLLAPLSNRGQVICGNVHLFNSILISIHKSIFDLCFMGGAGGGMPPSIARQNAKLLSVLIYGGKCLKPSF